MFCITARTSDLVQSKPVNRGTEGPWKVPVITALRKRGLTVGESLKMFFFFFFKDLIGKMDLMITNVYSGTIYWKNKN